MDGSWHLYRPGERWRGGPAWQVRVVLENNEWQAVGYRLPVVELLDSSAECAVGHLGPYLLADDWDLAEALRRLRAADGEIGMALVEQRNLAGLGNLYRTEMLFLRGVTPWTRVADVQDLPALVEKGRRLLLANRGHWEQSTTGSLRYGAMHWVFERSGQPCRRGAGPGDGDESRRRGGAHLTARNHPGGRRIPPDATGAAPAGLSRTTDFSRPNSPVNTTETCPS